MKTRRISLARAAICLLIAALVAASAGVASAQPKPDQKAVLANFEKSIDEGRGASVEEELFRYVVASPKDARGFYLLAKLRIAQGRLTEAKSLLGKSQSLDAAFVATRLALARVHFKLGETEAARAALAGVPDADLADDAARFTAAETAALVGDCPRALALADKLRPAVKNGKALPLRAGCLLGAGDAKGFAVLMPFGKTLAKNDPPVAVEFAGAMYKAAMFRETAELMRLTAAAAPKNVEALLLLAKSEISLKEYAKAKAHLELIEKLQPQAAELNFVRAMLEGEQGNNEAAFAALEKLLAQNPNDAQVLARYVVIALRANRSGDALRAADKLVALEPSNIDFLYLLGVAALQANNVAKAEASLIRFTAARPADSLGCLALGLTLAAQTDRIPEARAQLEKCLAANPDNFEAAYQLGLSYKVQGETAKAIEYLERTVKSAPNYAAALRELGTMYMQSGGEARARPVLEKAAAIAPNDAEVHFQLSRLYNLLGEPELARQQLELFQRLKNPKKDGM